MRPKRPAPSLVRRLTATFLLTNAGVVLLFFLFAMYPAAITEEDEPIGPDLVLLHLSDALLINDSGALTLRRSPELDRFARYHPGVWFVARSGHGAIRFGPVPAEVMRAGSTGANDVVAARYHNVGVRGPRGDAATEELNVGGHKVIAIVGGVVSADISFGQYLEYLWGEYWLTIPLALALFNLIGGLIAVPITVRSIRATADAAAALDPSDLSKRLPETGVVTELQPLVRAFNHALDRVAQAFDRRRRFIADVAHELRTPLAILTMHIETLPDGDARAKLQRTAFRLGQMVSQMLDAERLTLAGRRHERIDLVALARAAAAEVAPMAVAAGYQLAVTAPSEPVTIEGDEHALARSVTNLLGNAVAHGGGSGTIEVRVSPDGWLEVADQGPGVPLEARARIFEPFHRERWDRDGCGLGLHLVAEVMRAHGGVAAVVGTDEGSTFRLSFALQTTPV